jgi:hypothetical protein
VVGVAVWGGSGSSGWGGSGWGGGVVVAVAGVVVAVAEW